MTGTESKHFSMDDAVAIAARGHRRSDTIAVVKDGKVIFAKGYGFSDVKSEHR